MNARIPLCHSQNVKKTTIPLSFFHLVVDYHNMTEDIVFKNNL